MNGLDLMMYDRFLKIFTNCLVKSSNLFIIIKQGEKITINLINNTSYQGLLFSFDPIEVKFVILVNPKVYNKKTKEFKHSEESKLKINTSEISFLNISHKRLKKFSKGDFQTDVDISKKTSARLVMDKNKLVK